MAKKQTTTPVLTEAEKDAIRADFEDNGQGEPIFPETVDLGPVVNDDGSPTEQTLAVLTDAAPAEPWDIGEDSQTYARCGCGCGSPVRRRFLPGHDAKAASAAALAARAARSGSTLEEQIKRDAEHRAETAREKGRAKRAAERAAYDAAVAEAAAVLAETPEETAEALKTA